MINKFNNPRIINFCSCIPFVLLNKEFMLIEIDDFEQNFKVSWKK